MTRPKVDPDKRQRTAQACDSCKRRKQKCNGIKPCETCTKRNLECTYGVAEAGQDDLQRSPKRRMLEPVPNGLSIGSNNVQVQSPGTPHSHWSPGNFRNEHFNGQTPNIISNTPAVGLFSEKEDVQIKSSSIANDVSSRVISRPHTSDGQEEEAAVLGEPRMLKDPTGRFLYIGDSATLSFLQNLRSIVDRGVGPSPFTTDPRRHRIVENSISIPDGIRRTHLLPDKAAASVLVDSYFTNMNGLVELFHRQSVMMTLEACYNDPLSVDASWLCLLYLIFAIGLVMATPIPGSQEDAVIQKLRNEPYDRAEMFYLDAKQLADPSSGFEDAGFWSIQALTLMSIYTLAISKRNAAYAYYGMAVRSAFALGLHRDETMRIFSISEQAVRRNLWRSLFVLDRFLAASLGRPTAIRESDCSGPTLQTGEKTLSSFHPETNTISTHSGAVGLEAAVRSCHMIGMILESVYSKRKISTKVAQEIANHGRGWPKILDPSLQFRQATSTDAATGIAILHVNLLHCHSVILLTRPFFLFLMSKSDQERGDLLQRNDRSSSKMERFADACVIASTHSVALVQTALEARYLPHRNPFVLYFLFAAALIVLANEFSALVNNPKANASITNAVNVMNYFSQQDPQASRLLFILSAFRDVVVRQQNVRSRHLSANQTPQSFMNAPAVSSTDDSDPMGSLFTGNGPFSPTASAGPPKAEPATSRHNSDPKISPSTPHASLKRTSSHPNALFPSTTNGEYNPTRNPSLGSVDAFLDLSRVNSYPNSLDGNDSLEFDFDIFWDQNLNGMGMTPGGLNSGPMLGFGQPGMLDVQGISDSSVPLFGMNNSEFGGLQ